MTDVLFQGKILMGMYTNTGNKECYRNTHNYLSYLSLQILMIL